MSLARTKARVFKCIEKWLIARLVQTLQQPAILELRVNTGVLMLLMVLKCPVLRI